MKGGLEIQSTTNSGLQSVGVAEPWQQWLGYTSVDGQQEEVYPKEDRHGLPHPICELQKAAKRVRLVNRKLKAFEQGFIAEAGLKDRGWYKHLGVAPGRWLGKSYY